MGPLVAAPMFGGITILVLASWCIVMRHRRGVPPLPEKEPPLLKAARITHGSLYVLMIPRATSLYYYSDNSCRVNLRHTLSGNTPTVI